MATYHENREEVGGAEYPSVPPLVSLACLELGNGLPSSVAAELIPLKKFPLAAFQSKCFISELGLVNFCKWLVSHCVGFAAASSNKLCGLVG